MQSEDIDPIKVFLRGVWTSIPTEEDLSWVEEEAQEPGSGEPLGDQGPLIKDMLDKGVSPYAIARFAKLVAYNTAFNLCYHLEDPNASYEDSPEEEQLEWGLFLIDPKTGMPTEQLTGLHEQILSMDPSGREMRPKDA